MTKTTEPLAVISDDGKYRYTLKRILNKELPMIAFVGLNPSTADTENNDPTIDKCIHYCKQWGYGGFYMVNLFAYRATDRSQIYLVEDPIGPENGFHLKQVFDKVDKVICCWGNDGAFKARNREVLKMIQEPYCLSINATGEPAHPLYLSKSLTPIKYCQETISIAKSLGAAKSKFISQLKTQARECGLEILGNRLWFKPEKWTKHSIAFSFEMGGIICGIKRINEDKFSSQLPELKDEFGDKFEPTRWWQMYQFIYESISSYQLFVDEVLSGKAVERANDFLTRVLRKFGEDERF
jgi:hypothetical protein